MSQEEKDKRWKELGINSPKKPESTKETEKDKKK